MTGGSATLTGGSDVSPLQMLRTTSTIYATLTGGSDVSQLAGRSDVLPQTGRSGVSPLHKPDVGIDAIDFGLQTTDFR